MINVGVACCAAFDYRTAVRALALVLADPFVLVTLTLSFSIGRHKAINRIASVASFGISAEETSNYSLTRVLDAFSFLRMIIVFTYQTDVFVLTFFAVFSARNTFIYIRIILLLT